jgi:uncharacterized protein YdeI (YjbR/CyaY-like superfamily)
MEPLFFSDPSEFRKWLGKNHKNAAECWVGFYKAKSKKKGITYSEALDEALCFGWIDAVRKSLDDECWTIRFTPRKQRSIWSNINIRHIERLIKEGRMQPAGLAAYNARDDKRTGIYSFENKPKKLLPEDEKKFRKNKKAWKFFESMPPSYKRTAIFWVMSAKREETRRKRFETLIADSEGGRKIKPLRRTGE